MKRLLFLMLSLLALTARAQVSPDSIKFNEHGEFSIVVPVAATSEQIQAYSRSYFIVRDLYASSEIIQDDYHFHVLQAKSWVPGDDLTIYGKTAIYLYRNVKETFLMTITAKDNRFRAEIRYPMFEVDAYYENEKDFADHISGEMYYDYIHFAQKNGKQEDLTDRINNNRAIRYSNFLNLLVAYIEKQIKLDDF